MNNQFIQGGTFDWDRIDNNSYLKRIEAFLRHHKMPVCKFSHIFKGCTRQPICPFSAFCGTNCYIPRNVLLYLHCGHWDWTELLFNWDNWKLPIAFTPDVPNVFWNKKALSVIFDIKHPPISIPKNYNFSNVNNLLSFSISFIG